MSIYIPLQTTIIIPISITKPIIGFVSNTIDTGILIMQHHLIIINENFYVRFWPVTQFPLKPKEKINPKIP